MIAQSKINKTTHKHNYIIYLHYSNCQNNFFFLGIRTAQFTPDTHTICISGKCTFLDIIHTYNTRLQRQVDQLTSQAFLVLSQPDPVVRKFKDKKKHSSVKQTSFTLKKMDYGNPQFSTTKILLGINQLTLFYE